MKWVEADIAFTAENSGLAAELIADVFDDLGSQGVVVEGFPEEYGDGDWVDKKIQAPVRQSVKGYFAKNQGNLEIGRLLEQRLSRMKAAFERQKENGCLSFTVSYRDMDEEDWAESWKQFFFTEKITETIVIKPTWREYVPAPGELVLEIDPGMAFGTGTHPTTRMCIQLMESCIQPDAAVLDVGTGSGILTLAAARLGAGRLVAVDKDPVAVAVARQNLRRNHIPPDCHEIMTGNLTEGLTGTFSLIVANILSEVILSLADAVPGLLQPGGWFICSGIIRPKQGMIEEKLAALGLRVTTVLTDGEWVAMAATVSRR